MTGICSLVSVGQWTCIAEPSRLGRSECSCDRRLRWLKRQQGKRLTLLGLSFWGSKTFSQSRSPVSCLSCCRYARITSETGKSACEEICQTHCLSSQTLILARYLYPFEQLRERKNGPDHCVCAHEQEMVHSFLGVGPRNWTRLSGLAVSNFTGWAILLTPNGLITTFILAQQSLHVTLVSKLFCESKATHVC